MNQAWSGVEKLLNEMRFLLLESGVPEHQIRMPVGDPNRIKTETYTKAFDWLHFLRLSPEWEGVLKVKALLPQDRWDGYRNYGFNGLQEQILLQNAQAKLRKAWKRDRPHFFGKVYKDAQETENQQDADQEDSEQPSV